jgi:protein-S-isoprenylcysteine O-methyltransferase Ste14
MSANSTEIDLAPEAHRATVRVTLQNRNRRERRIAGPEADLPTRKLQRDMCELRGASMAQRTVLAACGAACVAIAWWLLFGGGIETVGSWLGRTWVPGDVARRACLAAALSIYYVRILFTEFVFLKRGVSWSEVFTIAPWMLCIYLLLGIEGGRDPEPLGLVAVIGIVLFLFGSWMNSYAEYARHLWKRLPENRGRLYTQGLFRYSRHPNYLGDLISFSGICLISGAWVTAVIPVLMLVGFVFVNVPVLDSHLHDHYGAAFDDYARHTRKLIPFLY